VAHALSDKMKIVGPCMILKAVTRYCG